MDAGINLAKKHIKKHINKEDPIYVYLLNWAKINDVDESEVEFWYLTMVEYERDVIRRRIDGKDTEKMNVEYMVTIMKDILTRKYG